MTKRANVRSPLGSSATWVNEVQTLMHRLTSDSEDAGEGIVRGALKTNDAVVLRQSFYGVARHNEAPDQDLLGLVKGIKAWGLREYYRYISTSWPEDDSAKAETSSPIVRFCGEGTDLILRLEGADVAGIQLATTSEELVTSISTLFFRHYNQFISERTENAGEVWVIIKTPNGYASRELGTIDHQLVRENYEDEILAQYDRVKKELEADTPFGRLFIFEGPPGTGKTHLIKGLVNGVENANFIFLPPRLAAEIDGPELIQILVNFAEGGMHLVLVIEDADELLVSREEGGITTLSTILQATAGIMGDLLDIRMIATTNSPRIHIDEAFCRDGRLGGYIHVGLLKQDFAQKRVEQLSGKTCPKPKKPLPLATVYRMARELEEDKP